MLDEVHNHHNFAWRERHQIDGNEVELRVVRKGAIPALPGQRGSWADLWATSAWSWRGRSWAGCPLPLLHRPRRWPREVIKPGAISQAMLAEWLRPHAGTVRILHELSPLGVAMAGANEFDSYKDWAAAAGRSGRGSNHEGL